jgi:hypothetical protein
LVVQLIVAVTPYRELETELIVGALFWLLARTVMVAELFLVPSVAEVAVTVTTRLLERAVAGAVYVVAAPLEVEADEMLPHLAPPQDSDQVTPPLVGSLDTVAVSCWEDPELTVAEPGVTDTEIAGMVTWDEACFVPSVTEVAVTVTVKLLAGAERGAV